LQENTKKQISQNEEKEIAKHGIITEMEERRPQQKTQRNYDYLKQYQWQKGQSGNITGGNQHKQKFKAFLSEFLENMSPEDKAKYAENLGAEFVIRMAEGNPETKTDITSGGRPLILPSELMKKYNVETNEPKGKITS